MIDCGIFKTIFEKDAMQVFFGIKKICMEAKKAKGWISASKGCQEPNQE